MFWLILAIVLLGALLAAPGRRLGARSFYLALLAPLALLVWALLNGPGIVDGTPAVERISWVPGLGLDLDLRIDGLSLLFLVLIGTAGLAIFGFAARYMPDEPRTARFAGVMTMFGGAMAGLVTADDLLGVFIFWELTTFTSYLLIGHDDQRPAARSAALQAALTTSIGGLAMLAGFVLLGQAAGTYSMSEILAAPPTGIDLALVLVLVGAFTKSAQFPFHFWLPGAMAAPTPASAFLHSATMVKAGIYLIARFSPTFADLGWWQPVVVGAGLITMVIGGWRALRQHDLKVLLAHGTVSQLGFLVALLGFGEPALTSAGLALLLAHGAFKAALFMVVGAVDHEAGGRDIRKLSGLRHTMPRTFWVAVVALASMAAIPPTFGFVAKEAAFDALIGGPVLPIVVIALASAVTVAYSARFLFESFTGAVSREAAAAHEAPGGLVGWPAFLAGLSLLLGFVPATVEVLTAAATESLTGDPGGKLLLWPGFKPALALSAAVLVTGAVLTRFRVRVEILQGRLADLWRGLGSADGAYQASLKGLLSSADRMTGLIQNGSLPTYLMVILLTAVTLPVGTALLAGRAPLDVSDPGNVLQWTLAIAVTAACIAIVRARRRFGAVVLLGAVGYGLAGIYLIQGAPDLALTQLLVETLTVVLFALVLIRLPERFGEAVKPAFGRVARVLASVAVAAFVAVGALLAGTARTAEPISREQVERSVPEAGGANVVNTILVDFRGFDTLGEITVLVVAGLGVAGLVVRLLRKEEPA